MPICQYATSQPLVGVSLVQSLVSLDGFSPRVKLQTPPPKLVPAGIQGTSAGLARYTQCTST
eukprot:m.35157 g.35157  ORF g.35157 m.35157 type:complete len:62 (+) comp12370_c0_seq1:986-1171(+)